MCKLEANHCSQCLPWSYSNRDNGSRGQLIASRRPLGWPKSLFGCHHNLIGNQSRSHIGASARRLGDSVALHVSLLSIAGVLSSLQSGSRAVRPPWKQLMAPCDTAQCCFGETSAAKCKQRPYMYKPPKVAFIGADSKEQRQTIESNLV